MASYNGNGCSYFYNYILNLVLVIYNYILNLGQFNYRFNGCHYKMADKILISSVDNVKISFKYKNNFSTTTSSMVLENFT